MVEVWWAGVGEARPEFERDLDRVERERLAAYVREVDQARFLLGVTIVRQVLAARFSLPAAKIMLDRTCSECGKPHGKVRAVGLPVELSVTHSGQLVGVAVADRPVGLDVERVDPELDVDGVARVALSADEVRALHGHSGIEKARAFTTYWTRREAVVKATGVGLRGKLRADVPAGIQVRELDVGDDHRAALAVVTAEPPAVRTLRFGSDLRR
ncbi:4'-phosphopantetheinyl transferase family protein [Kribbella shirazensis]|uniref:4'-phosphopantetheinyl transferase n=1 Tax=Kribbella shirazensis TaxID=1105143 RepID=A0A7X5VJ67_9ACTN|nr:4'-phosphopantetheinyl transferase superfamily protein [Kribbella shirazensis]NIK61103.1 4'-phosphopantetheinyl transferase [Kribbella shirazensis]